MAARLPCCIAPFSARGYETYTLGDATQQTLREIWNGPAYQEFRQQLLWRRAAQALPELRPAMEPLGVAVVIPTLERGGGDRRRRRARFRVTLAREIIVADGGSCDGTPELARTAGARVIVREQARLRSRLRRRRRRGRRAECAVIVFMDGDGADRGDLMARLVDPISRRQP